MKAQECHIAVALVEHPSVYPEEVWDLNLWGLDMNTDEVIEELQAIAWAEKVDYPNSHAVSVRGGQVNWGASGSHWEIVMQVATGTAGGVGTAAFMAAVKVAYEKLTGQAQSEAWASVPTEEEAIQLAKSRLNDHYDVAVDRLTVVRSHIDDEAQRYDLDFAHEDGRKFGATVGAVAGIASCTRIWWEGGPPLPRPLPQERNPGN